MLKLYTKAQIESAKMVLKKYGSRAALFPGFSKGTLVYCKQGAATHPRYDGYACTAPTIARLGDYE